MTLYQEIENQIMIWGHDGTKTAGSLTRKIMKLIEEENKKELREIKIDLVFEKNGQKWSNNDDTAGDNFGSFIEGAKWVLDKMNKKQKK
jgi:hypothetical protein